MAVNRFGAVVFSPQFPTDQFKPVPLLHSRYLDHCHGRQVPDSVLLYGFGVCRRAGMYAAVVFYVPLVLITILYLILALTIKSQKTAGEQSVSRRGQRLKREKIVLEISIAIVSAFTMGWLPLSIWWFVYFYSSDKTVIWSCGFQYFAEIVRFLMYSYCAVSPCICFIFIGHYRQGLKNLLNCFSMAPGAYQVAPP